MKGIVTVFVDIDDTLWWFTENSKLALRHTFDAFDISSVCTYERFKEVYLKKNLELWNLYHHGLIDKDFLVNERFRFTLKECGYKGDVEKMCHLLDEEYLRFLALQPTTIPGARQLLEYLVAKGYDVNTLSNGFQGTQQQKLISGGLSDLIHRNVLSDDCGITKPQRGIFDYALEQCGAEAATTVMIGDNPDTDIHGARQAGLPTIFFNRKPESIRGVAADYEIHSLHELLRLL